MHLKLISLLLLPFAHGAKPKAKVSKVRKRDGGVYQSPVPYPAEDKNDAEQDSNTKTKRPNILLILADDVGTEDIPGYWGTNVAQMPNMQKLQAQGVTFFNAHSSPLCAPSRYMLLSGNYQHRGNKVPSTWNFSDGLNQFRANQKSIAHALKEGGGYHSAMLGKWHIGLKLPQGGGRFNRTNILSAAGLNWTLPVRQGPNDVGFDYSYFTSGGIQEAPYSFFRNGFLETDPSNVVFWPKGSYEMKHGLSAIRLDGEGDPDWDSTAYNMILVNETNAFLDYHMENRKDDPFFAYVALGSVHIPHSPPRQYLDGSPVAGENLNLHLDMLFEMDKVIGSLVDSIEQRGLANETIIIFSSDNGGINALSYAERKLRGHKGKKIIYWAYCTIYSISEF
jgi:arylsulfatase A-like enzyme